MRLFKCDTKVAVSEYSEPEVVKRERYINGEYQLKGVLHLVYERAADCYGKLLALAESRVGRGWISEVSGKLSCESITQCHIIHRQSSLYDQNAMVFQEDVSRMYT